MQPFNVSLLSTSIIDLFFSKECYAIYLEDKFFQHGECLQLLLSKVIGYTIMILSSTMIKVPQILKIVQNQSAEGVSLISHLMLFFSSATSFTYGVARNFPISVWGENVAMSLQNAVLCVLICMYCGRRTALACIIATLSLVSMGLLLHPVTPMPVHYFLAMFNLPMTTGSKIIQIYSNFMNQGTGQLSLLSICTLNFRSIGRFFTYLIETGDLNKMAVYASASVGNVVLLGQMIYYNMFKPKKLKQV